MRREEMEAGALLGRSRAGAGGGNEGGGEESLHIASAARAIIAKGGSRARGV